MKNKIISFFILLIVLVSPVLISQPVYAKDFEDVSHCGQIFGKTAPWHTIITKLHNFAIQCRVRTYYYLVFYKAPKSQEIQILDGYEDDIFRVLAEVSTLKKDGYIPTFYTIRKAR